MVYKRTAPGQKTPRMLQVEAHLGRTLEEDYREFYLEKKLGQKRLADRWGVRRNMIFDSNKRNRCRSWVEMLGLLVRRLEEPTLPTPRPRPACEACSENTVPLERAHWWEAKDRGPASPENIVLLCPNCHSKLDRQHDPALTERIRAILLHRAASKVLAKGCTPEQFLLMCEQIINARKSVAQQGAPADGPASRARG